MHRRVLVGDSPPAPIAQRIEYWAIERLVEYARNPRRNDAAVDRMCASIREFGFKIPCLVGGDGEVVDGHLRLKSARKLGLTEIPVILCDEWTPAQVKAFRLLVNRSVTWADWDEELLALESREIQESDLDLSLTGFDPGEIDALLALDDDEKANAAPPLPESPVSLSGDLWLLGKHRVLCGDATSSGVDAQLLGERKPRLMVTDPPYGIGTRQRMERQSGLKWSRAGGAKLYEKAHRGPHRDVDIRRHARGLVRGVRACTEPGGGLCMACQQIHTRSSRRLTAHWVRPPSANYLEQGQDGSDQDLVLVRP